MSETFYTVLGVNADADVGDIRDAYRRRIKESHPDVSDDPGAPREFRRLTTARDVLTDAAERARYDRLGHGAYVERHVETSAWTGTADSGSSTGRSRSGGATGRRTEGATERRAGVARNERREQRHHRTATGGDDRSAWLGEDWDGPRARQHRNQRAAGTDRRASTTDEEAWQHASAAYRYTPSSGTRRSRSTLGSVSGILSSVVPWLVVHLVLVTSAVVMAWYMYAGTAGLARYSILSLLFGVLLVGLVALLSAMHLVSVVYG